MLDWVEVVLVVVVRRVLVFFFLVCAVRGRARSIAVRSMISCFTVPSCC